MLTLFGKDGNVFNLIGIAENTLKKAGLKEQAKEFIEKAFNAGDYDEVLENTAPLDKYYNKKNTYKRAKYVLFFCLF